MVNYTTSGTYNVIGLTSPVSVTVETGRKTPPPTVTLNTTGIADTFNISTLTGSTLILNEDIAGLSVYNLTIDNATATANNIIGAATTNNVLISNGGEFDAGGIFLGLLNPGSTIAFGIAGADTNLLDIVKDTTLLNLSGGTVISGFNTLSDEIDDGYVAFSNVARYSITTASGGIQTLTFLAGNGSSLGSLAFSSNTFGTGQTGTFAIGDPGGPLTSTSDADGNMDFVRCFLSGTMIATPRGDAAVETLRVGDLVHVVEAGRIIVRPLTWTGGRSVRTSDFADCSEAFPIRIRQHAFAPHIPQRDLLVTPEHCILTEAGLVPARMLVNGTSIVIDRDITEYEFFHIELESHGILLSEGLTTESYLDGGNHGLFADASAGICNDSVMAAPLAVSRELVEPIWNRLVQRARELGFEDRHAVVAMTDQPNLRLLLDDGSELATCWHNDIRHMFHIPTGATPVRLLSRTAVPAEMIGPFVDDRRILGVAIDKIVLWNGLYDQVMPAADLDLAGWYRNEDGRRWTNGNASLDLPRADGQMFLDIHLAATLLYPEEERIAA